MRKFCEILLPAIVTALLLVSAASHADPKAQAQQAEPQRPIADALNNISMAYRKQAERAEAQKDTEPCKAGDDRRYSNLCAQWKAADAAADAAKWGRFGFLAGVISVAAVIVALFISIWSNLIIRRTAKHELRAYMGVKSVTAAPSGADFMTAQIIVFNFGSTPAQKVSAKVKGIVCKFPSSVLDGNHPEPEDHICPATVHPGSEFEIYAGAPIESVGAIFDGEDGFYVYGSVEYTDFDGEHRKTNFCFRGTESTLMNKGQMQVSFEGNDAT